VPPLQGPIEWPLSTAMTYSGPSPSNASKFRLVVMISATVWAMLVPLGMAQSQASATIRGRVEDSQGHAVAGATVHLQHSSEAQATQTDKDGGYSFMPSPGDGYTLRVGKAGMGEATFGPLALKADEIKNVDLKLASTTAEFYDEPQFTVSGVSDVTAPAGHGSDTVLRTSESFAKDVASLNKERSRSVSAKEEKSLREMADREPSNFEANHLVGELLARSGRPCDAISFLERAAQVKGDDYANSFDLARAYVDAGQYERAQTISRELLGRRDIPELHHLLADTEEKLGDPVAAVREYQRAAEMDPSENNLFDWGAELLIHRALQPAIEVYKKGTRLYPQSPRMLIGLGVSWYATGSYDQAVESLCRAADLKPEDPQPYLFLGKMQSVSPYRSEALTERLARFAKIQPGNALAKYYYAVSLWDRPKAQPDREGQVDALLNEALRLDPKLAPAHLQLGILYAERKDLPKAIAEFKRALEIDPQLEEGHFRLAQAYRLSGDQTNAQQELRLFNEISKQHAEQIDRDRHDLGHFVYTLRSPSQ
jgi:tetratricopeptide (TPR) repeat protein